MKSPRHFFTIALVVLLVGVFIGCNDDDSGNGTGSASQPPVISSLTSTPNTISVDLDSIAVITVVASDPENDELTFRWDATAGILDTVDSWSTGSSKSNSTRGIKELVTGKTTVYWKAPSQALNSMVIVWASDGENEVYESIEFDYQAFAPNQPPVIEAVTATPGHIYTYDGSDDWWLSLYCKIQNGGSVGGVSRVTAQVGGGQYYNLTDDGTVSGDIPGDYEFYGFPGPSIVITLDSSNTNSIEFIAYNNYNEKADTSFLIHFLPDSIPLVYAPSAPDSGIISGDVMEYYNILTPTFQWRPYPDVDSISYDDVLRYEVQVKLLSDSSDVWSVDSADVVVADDDTLRVLYNYNQDYINSPPELEMETSYIFILTVWMENAWATREREFRITVP